MAAPRDKTIHNLSGQWKFVSFGHVPNVNHEHTTHPSPQNHALSDDIGAAMAVQGVNLILRTALARAPISLTIAHTQDAATGVETLSTRQSTIGRTMEDRRTLDGEEVATSHVIFGQVKSWACFVAVDKIATQLLREGWEDDTRELIEMRSQGLGWTSWQAWGFEVIDGQRYHVRRTILQKGIQVEEVAPEHVLVRMVYDWVGS